PFALLGGERFLVAAKALLGFSNLFLDGYGLALELGLQSRDFPAQLLGRFQVLQHPVFGLLDGLARERDLIAESAVLIVGVCARELFVQARILVSPSRDLALQLAPHRLSFRQRLLERSKLVPPRLQPQLDGGDLPRQLFELTLELCYASIGLLKLT